MNADDSVALVAGWLDIVHVESAGRRCDGTLTEQSRKDESRAEVRQATNHELARTTLHEATHAVVAERAGISVKRAFVRRDASGAVEYSDAIKTNAFAAVVIGLAPMFCELIKLDVGVARQFVLAHSFDVLKARTDIDGYRQQFPGIGNERFARFACYAMLAQWDAIQRVAAVLQIEGEIDGASVSALCGKAQ